MNDYNLFRDFKEKVRKLDFVIILSKRRSRTGGLSWWGGRTGARSLVEILKRLLRASSIEIWTWSLTSNLMKVKRENLWSCCSSSKSLRQSLSENRWTTREGRNSSLPWKSGSFFGRKLRQKGKKARSTGWKYRNASSGRNMSRLTRVSLHLIVNLKEKEPRE